VQLRFSFDAQPLAPDRLVDAPVPARDASPDVPPVFVRHRRARRYILRVLPDGRVRVTLPRWGTVRQARAFLAASSRWVAKQRARLSRTPDRGTPVIRPFVERWFRGKAERELPGMLLALAREHRITVARVSVRDQQSRWGACSAKGVITLNWRLIRVPAFVREYVLLHELMHRRELNHSRRFWRLVAAACPAHAEARRWLRKEGKLLWADAE
jgi:predicted metal-dependent hydrolase